jgi:hypothetical protein
LDHRKQWLARPAVQGVLLTNPERATPFSVHELEERTGTQGAALLMRLALACEIQSPLGARFV